jgi:7-cyano-7-deazaguanine synthase
MSSSSRKAVILLSGGLDSTTVLAQAQADGYEVYALSFQYGQRHSIELDVAKRVAEQFGVKEHKVAQIDLRLFGGSALTDDIDVPKDRDPNDTSIPITYVPARNTIFLSFALAWAEVLKAYDIFIGVNVMDYSGYPDCRPAFVEAFENLANLATAYGVEGGQRIRIHSPLLNMSKADIVQMGMKLGVDYSKTLSCYDPSPQAEACGECDACVLRQRGFHQNGLEDPAAYVKRMAKA